MELEELNRRIEALERGESFRLDQLPEGLYHGCDAWSRSNVVTIERSPMHFWDSYLSDEPAEDKGLFVPFEVGRAFHALVLEPERDFESELIIYEPINRRTKAGKEEWALIEEEVKKTGKTALSVEEWDDVRKMAEAVRKHPIVRNVFQNGEAETSIFWRDSETGIPLKVRLDYIRNDLGMLADLKSCTDARPDAVSRSLFSYKYYVQAGMYQYGARIGMPNDDHNWANFVFVFMEKTRPYACQAYVLDEYDVGLGYDEFRRCLNKLATCLEKDYWPGYPQVVTPVSLSNWARNNIASGAAGEENSNGE